MSTTFRFTIQSEGTFPNNKVALDRFLKEIQDSSITIAVDSVVIDGGDCVASFKADLSEAEALVLEQIVFAHSGEPLPVDSQKVILSNPQGTPLATSSDGRLVQRVSFATPGRGVNTRFFNFNTADPGSLVNKSWNNTDYTDASYHMFNAQGAETQNGEEAVRTHLDFESTVDIEIGGGGFYIDPTLAGGSTREWFAAAVAAPGIPVAMGGQIEFATKLDLEMITDGWFDIDGRSAMVVKYDPVYHSGLIRFIFWHPAGAKKRMLVYLEAFR